MKALEVKLFDGWLGKTLAQVLGKPKSLRFRLARDTVGVMVIQAVSMGLTFAVSVALARLLSVREFGLYSLAMSVLSLLVVPATFGFPQLLGGSVKRRGLSHQAATSLGASIPSTYRTPA